MRGETKGALLTSELFDRADEDRGRRLVIVSRASSFFQRQAYLRALVVALGVGSLTVSNGGYRYSLGQSRSRLSQKRGNGHQTVDHAIE
jgi:hypothetical protein